MARKVLPIPAHIASLAPRDAADAQRLVARVPAGANAIEFRMDLAPKPIPAAALAALDPRPAILTWRSLAEGGSFSGSAEEYRRLVDEAYASGATVDVEHARGLLGDRAAFPERERRRRLAALALLAAVRLGEPGSQSMREAGARAVKLVAGAADLAGGLRIAELQRRQGEGVALFPMGPASGPGRVLAALFGAALVYGPVERETAAGQIAIGDLLVDLRGRPPATDRGALRRRRGQHGASRSRRCCTTRSSARADLPVSLPAAPGRRLRPGAAAGDRVRAALPRLRRHAALEARGGAGGPAVRGRAADRRVEHARARPRRRLARREHRRRRRLRPAAGPRNGEGRSAVVIGAGGAARAAIVAARRLGYEVVVTARRDAEADRLAEAFHVDSMAWSDLAASEADLYVNATPVGWRDEDPSAVPVDLLEARPLVFDCVYRRDGRETSTIRAARAAKCPTVEGLQMFAIQAVRQAQLFGVEGVTPEEVAAILREALRA